MAKYLYMLILILTFTLSVPAIRLATVGRRAFMHTVSQKKHVTLILFEHNSNINCPIIIIFGTDVTETISY